MKTKDLTFGKPWQVLLRFSVPMLLSMIFQQFYNITDSAIVGQMCSTESFAAVSVSYPVTVLFVAFASGASIGVSVVTSHLFGEKRMRQVRTCANTSLLSMTAIGLLLTLIGALCCEPLLWLMNTDALLFDEAAIYLWIYIAGVTFLFLYNTANGIFTALGDSVTPLVLLICSSLLNIVLDIVFVGWWGVAGAAWATFIAQGLASTVAVILILRRLGALPDTAGYRLFDGAVLKRIMRIALPSICQHSFVSVGQLFVQGAVNEFSPAVQSGYGGAFKINTFTINCLTTMSNSLSSYVAQNTGAQQWGRIREGRRVAMRMTCLFAIGVGAAVMLLSWPLMSMFTQDDEVKAIGQQFLWTVCPFYGIVAIKIINDGVFRGVGAIAMFVTGTFVDLGLRVASSYVLPAFIGEAGIWWGFPIGWVVSTILSVLLYRFGRWCHAAHIRRKVSV